MYWFGLVSVEVEKSSIATENENQFFLQFRSFHSIGRSFGHSIQVAKLSLKLFFIKNFTESKIKFYIYFNNFDHLS